MSSVQSSFNTPIERTREVLERAKRKGLDKHPLNLAVSGGLDSAIAADIMCRIGPEYGFEPDSITHINTGAAVPQSRLVAKVMAERWGLKFIEQGYRNRRNSLAFRVLGRGWPGGFTGSVQNLGHGREWANRKNKPMDEVYMMFDGQQTWVTGVRKLESKRRQGNVADGAIDRDKPRRTWVSPIVGWTDGDKRKYVKKHNIPVSEAYLILGFSAECVACSFDDAGLLTDLELLCPELAHAIRTLAVWLYMRVRRGDLEIAPKRLMWGWEPDEAADRPEDVERDLFQPGEYRYFQFDNGVENGMQVSPAKGVMLPTKDISQDMVGCNAGTCSTRNAPEWIRNLDSKQIVDRNDVISWWNGDIENVVSRFT